MALSIKALDLIEPIKLYYDKVAEIALSVLKKLPPEVLLSPLTTALSEVIGVTSLGCNFNNSVFGLSVMFKFLHFLFLLLGFLQNVFGNRAT